MAKTKISKLAITLIAVLLSAVWWLPTVWTLIVSLKPYDAVVTDVSTWLDPPFTLNNFIYVLNNDQADMIRWLINSFIIAAIETFGVAALSLMAAYSFSRFRYPGRKLWFWIIMAGMMVPAQSLMIPLYLLFRQMNILNTYHSLILPGMGSAFGVILLKQFMDGLPESLFDAARIDGAGSFRMLISLVAPLTRPAMSSLMIFTFLQKWNDFLWPFISITKKEIMTVPVGIVFFRGQTDMQMAYAMAANVVAILPVLIVFFFFQRQIVQGIAFSGIKE